MKFCPQCSAFYPNDATFCPSDGTALSPVKDPYIGRTIASRYRLVKRLGAGGMSSVYLAHHVMIDRLSAIKILRQDLARHPTHKERFLREARAVNRINHPNIVEISDMGEADGVTYLVMEYVDGPSLHEELDKGVMPWPRAVRIGLQVAAALGRAHQMGVVHRDLKPENILIARRPKEAGVQLTYTADDLVKLTDFGIAKLTDEPSLTVGEHLFGTPGYIAPEYVEGLPVDARSDLYGLGVILYECTTGALPFDGKGMALLTAAVQGSPVPPSERPDAPKPYPEALERLILRLLSRSPEARPPHAFAVYDALVGLLDERALSGEPEEDDVPPPLPSTVEVAHAGAFAETAEDAPMSVGDSGTGPATMVEPLPPAGVAAHAAVHATETSDLAAVAAIGTVQWHAALGRLEGVIAEAQRDPGASKSPERIERAVELATLARAKVRNLERASLVVGGQQERLDALEEEGRVFRADIGRALDQLVLDRARAISRAKEVTARLLTLDGAAGADRGSDAFLWEATALRVASGSSDVDLDDLTLQIEALEQRLQERNAALEVEIVEATGALEGSLAAVRHLTHELERLLDEATAEVDGPGAPRVSPAGAGALWGLVQGWRGGGPART